MFLSLSTVTTKELISGEEESSIIDFDSGDHFFEPIGLLTVDKHKVRQN